MVLAEVTVGGVIALIVIGLVVGALGRLFHPGRDPIGLLATMAVGIAAVLIVGLLLEGPMGFWAYVLAVVVAVLLVAVIARAWRSPRRLA